MRKRRQLLPANRAGTPLARCRLLHRLSRAAFLVCRFCAASRPKTYLMEAIVVTLLCCIPFGIVAIVYAAQVDSKFKAGDYQGAQKAAHSAKTWYHVALISGLVIIAISITSKIATSN